jgi:hypothetical protein
LDNQVLHLIVKSMDDYKTESNRRFDELRDELIDLRIDVKSNLIFKWKVTGMWVGVSLLSSALVALGLEFSKWYFNK